MTLRLALLGSPQIWLNGHLLERLRSDKARALLFYLAVTGRPQKRGHLANVFWLSDSAFAFSSKSNTSAEERARTNLRHEVSVLRKAGLDPYLLINDETLAFNLEADVELDFLELEALVSKTSTQHNLEKAVALYRGAFLENFEIEKSPDFDEWATQQSSRFEDLIFQALRYLIRFHADAGHYGISLQYVNRWIDLAPSEEAYQYKVVLLTLNEEYERARTFFERYSRTRADEQKDFLPRELRGLNHYELLTLLPAGLPLVETPPTFTPTKPFQAPALLDLFVGREDEAKKLRAELTSGQHPICAIVGMGGIGKSSLAIKLAHELRHHFEDGVLWADLAYSDPMDVLEMWGITYGAANLSRYPDLGTRSAAFRHLMSNKQALLVLDGVTDEEQIEMLLPGSPRCAVLITTRNRYLVSKYRKIFGLKVLDKADSLTMLVNAVGKARIQAEMEYADGILNLLEHLPLAVEIAAQRLAEHPDRTLKYEHECLSRANERLKRLSVGKRAVRASFEESWVLMAEADQQESSRQRVFKALGVFAERIYSFEAAAYVAELDEDEADEIIPYLCALSLVMREGKRRYRMHTLLAEFAREKLGKNLKPYQRMATYYAEFGQKNQQAFKELDGEWGNLNAGMQIAYDHKNWPLLIHYAESLSEAWFALGRYTDARRVYRWLCNTQEAELYGDVEALGNRFCQLANATIEQGDYDEAEQHIGQSVDIFEELKDQKGIAQTKYLLGWVAIKRNNFIQAQTLLDECLQMRESLADWVGVADALYLMADIQFADDRPLDARPLAQKALQNYQQAEHAVGVIKILGLLADITIWEQDYKTAEEHCLAALKICEELHEMSERFLILYILALVYRYQMRFDEALAMIEESLRLSQAAGHRLMQARGLWRRGTIYEKMERLEQAVASFEASLRLSSPSEDLNYQKNFDRYKTLRDNLNADGGVV